MHAQTTPGILTVGHRGVVALAFALLAAASLAWIWVISVSTTFDPPQWARVAGSSLLPVGLVGAVVTAVLARRSVDRPLAAVALAVCVAVVVAFVVLYVAYGG